MSNEWLATLKTGDEVAIESGYSGGYELLTVDRTTNTQIICGNARYRRDSGRRVGGSGYRVAYLREVTQTVRDKIERDRLLMELNYMKWNTLDTDCLRRVVAALRAAPSRPPDNQS